MEDEKFLHWLYLRLKHVHNENPNADYMHKLKAIINGMDKTKITPNVITPTESGEGEEKSIDDMVDEWHDSESTAPLHEYLGMTWKEYKAWVINPTPERN